MSALIVDTVQRNGGISDLDWWLRDLIGDFSREIFFITTTEQKRPK